jgi:lipopolysaccharide transport system permease protein
MQPPSPGVGNAEPSLSFDAADPRRLARGLADLELGLRRWRLAGALAALDIRNRYRGSVLGPLWMSLSTAVTLLALGLLYSRLFRMDLQDYIPFLVVSLILWNIISQVVNEACSALVASEGIIRQMPLPYTTHALRCLMRNGVVAGHNLPLILLAFVIFWRWPGLEVLWAIPGFLLVLLNAFAAVLFLGMLCARFRDIGPIVQTVMQLAFFISPVIWKPELLGQHQVWLALNPFYDLMEVVRGPLLGAPPSALVWAGALVTTLLSCGISAAFFVRFRGRIAFWV